MSLLAAGFDGHERAPAPTETGTGHLPDGPEQRGRDAQMASSPTGMSVVSVAWSYQHDAGGITPNP